ncbi:MAG: hypothetical protein Q8Q42_00540 [Nanoarchaeota archaeon]|nr:hypothetical protein [Nanoarchaeota archaeon]
MKASVLIGTPTHEEDKIFFESYFNSIKNQDYPCKLIVADNSKSDDYSNELKKKNIDVIKVSWIDSKYDRVLESRKEITKKFLEGDYTHLFWVDSDIILPKKAISVLLEANKDIISGVYLSSFTYPQFKLIHPVAYKLTHDENLRLPLQAGEIRINHVKEMHSVGFGCCLIKKEVAEKIRLRRIPNTSSTEDILFCSDARKNNYKTFIHAGVLCKHGHKMDDGIHYLDANNYIK